MGIKIVNDKYRIIKGKGSNYNGHSVTEVVEIPISDGLKKAEKIERELENKRIKERLKNGYGTAVKGITVNVGFNDHRRGIASGLKISIRVHHPDYKPKKSKNFVVHGNYDEMWKEACRFKAKKDGIKRTPKSWIDSQPPYSYLKKKLKIFNKHHDCDLKLPTEKQLNKRKN